MKNLDINVLNAMVNNCNNALARTARILDEAALLEKMVRRSVFENSYVWNDLDSRSRSRIIDGVHSACWRDFFDEYDVYHMYVGQAEYSRLVSAYIMPEYDKLDYAQGVKELVPFTRENAIAFYEKHIAPTVARLYGYATKFLAGCGADYNKRPAKFSAKMTYRNFDGYNASTDIAVNLLRTYGLLSEGADGRDYKYIFGVMRNSRVCGERVEYFDGAISIERSQNGNATFRFSPDAVKLLNSTLDVHKMPVEDSVSAADRQVEGER